MINILSQEQTILNRFIAEIRDAEIQTDPLRFRRNLERIGEVTAYEISKTLTYAEQSVRTPLGESLVNLPTDEVVLATILRAGLPYHNGFLNYFDRSHCSFVSAYRKSHKSNTFEIKLEYLSCGSIEGKVLIIADPMLATGSTFELAYRALAEKGGEPKHIHIAAAIASEQGVERVKASMPMEKTTIWCGAVDEEMTSKYYIVPGLGDAGDLAYGSKLK